jgi:hypothetical protein
MIIACLGVFVAIVIADYYVQRKAARDALALAKPSHVEGASPAPSPTFTPTSTPIPKPTPTETPEPDLAAGLIEVPEPSQAPLQRTTPPPTPTPSPRLTPRYVSLVNAHDVLNPAYGQYEDTRRYRFHVEKETRVKGNFSARGNVSVRIVAAGIDPRYSSGGEISADTIDVFLYAGSYELVVTARKLVSFSVELAAYYDPE